MGASWSDFSKRMGNITAKNAKITKAADHSTREWEHTDDLAHVADARNIPARLGGIPADR
jgi:hypothetical protein